MMPLLRHYAMIIDVIDVAAICHAMLP